MRSIGSNAIGGIMHSVYALGTRKTSSFRASRAASSHGPGPTLSRFPWRFRWQCCESGAPHCRPERRRQSSRIRCFNPKASECKRVCMCARALLLRRLPIRTPENRLQRRSRPSQREEPSLSRPTPMSWLRASGRRAFIWHALAVLSCDGNELAGALLAPAKSRKVERLSSPLAACELAGERASKTPRWSVNFTAAAAGYADPIVIVIASAGVASAQVARPQRQRAPASSSS